MSRILTVIWLTVFGLPSAANAKLVIGRVVLHGQEKTTVHAVKARIRMREGDPITFDVLEDARQRLEASGLFSEVDVWVDLPRKEAVRLMYLEDSFVKDVDLHVTLEEKQSWFIFPIASAGGADFSAGAVYFDRNLFGTGMEIVGAGQYGASRTFGVLGFRHPIMTFAPFSYAIGGSYRLEEFRFFEDHKQLQEVDMEVIGGEMQLGYGFSTYTRAIIGGLYQRLNIQSLHLEGLEALQPGAPAPQGVATCLEGAPIDANGEPILLLQPYNCQSGNIVGLLFQLVYDQTSSPEGIRKGVAVSFNNEIADAFWRSDFDYVKAQLQLGLYGYIFGTYPSVVFRGGVIYPTSERGTPISQLFRAGGATLRGYLNNEFRGDTLISMQLEEQVKLFSIRPLWNLNFVGAMFADVAALLERHPGGRVSTDPKLQIEPRPNLKDFHTSIGAGIRFLLPGVVIPAVRIDLGYGIDVRDFAITFTVAKGSL